jgi:hypothetical protein
VKVGDLVKNLHALDRCDLGLIVRVKPPSADDWLSRYLVQWLDPPDGRAETSWNSDKWLDKV